MKITVNQLRKIIKEEVSKVLKASPVNQTEAVGSGTGTGERVEQAFLKYVDMHPELMEDPGFEEGMDRYDYTTSYSEAHRANLLVLGTTRNQGGDHMYDVIADAGLIADLEKFIAAQVGAAGPATKTARKFKVIPYSKYQWNEDVLGADL